MMMYTQSRKKRTMNSLAYPVTQGQGQVTLVDSHLILFECATGNITFVLHLLLLQNTQCPWAFGPQTFADARGHQLSPPDHF